MAEAFLKEQLERIRKLTERMSAVQDHASRLVDEMAHDRESMRQSPLQEVRDYRPYYPPDDTATEFDPREHARRKRRR